MTSWISHCTFEKCLEILFIESLMLRTDHLYLSLSVKERRQSFVHASKVFAYNNPQGKDVMFPILHFSGA